MKDLENNIVNNQKDAVSIARARILFIKICCIILFAVITFRLFKIQVFESSKYKAIAKKQYERVFTLPAQRGNIYDKNFNVIASNVRLVSFAADPKIVGENINKVSQVFAKIFGKPISHYKSKLMVYDEEKNPKRFVWLERKVKPEIANKIETAKLEGIVMINESKRLYHYDDLASSLIGFTNVDNKGIAGIELQYENEMAGKNGSVMMQRDGLGRVRPSADYPQKKPIDGNNINLTIDITYQSIVDEELKNGVEQNQADGGCAVMMNPKTGEILAMSVYPCINPNNITAESIGLSRNKIVSDVFEPGSVFKIVAAVAGYENNLVTSKTVFNAEHGRMKIPDGKNKFRYINDTHEYDLLTFNQAIELSSNIVFAKLGKMIGGELLFKQARDFGFGMITGIDLPGEVRGVLKKPSDKDWSGATTQSMSYGYEIGATPLQIVCAYSAIANNGILMKPFVVSSITNSNGEKIFEQYPKEIRRVASESTINKLIPSLVGVVENGTGKEVKINGIRIAGKTGTSRKYIDGKYADNSYTASFVGFFPVENPQVVCLVMMDNPKARGYYGGTTSGPVFKSIAERVITLSYKYSNKVFADVKNNANGIITPDVKMISVGLAKKMLATNGLNVRVFGNGNLVIKQMPEAGKKIESGETVSLISNSEPIVSANGSITVPDVKGMSMRRAMNRLVSDDFEIKVKGSGIVVQQYPNAGEQIKIGATIAITCMPNNLHNVTLY